MAAKTINGLHGRVIPCRAAIELDWVADVSSLGSLLDRRPRPLTMCIPCPSGTCRSSLIARKLKLLHPGRAFQTWNREIGTQRLHIPRRAALSRHNSSCFEDFGLEMARPLGRAPLASLFPAN